MYRSALIFGVVGLLVAAGATLITPLCGPCAVVFLGLGAGYLAGAFDKPQTGNATTRGGAIAGAIGGVGPLLGQSIGAVINGMLVVPERAMELARAMGIPTSGGFEFQPGGYWTLLIGTGLCLSVLDVVLMALFGVVGGLIWWNMSGKNSTPPAAAPLS